MRRRIRLAEVLDQKQIRAEVVELCEQQVLSVGRQTGIGHVAFTAQDVIRHELVARIVEAYDQAAARKRESKG